MNLDELFLGLPHEHPLDMKIKADQFNHYVMDPRNGVMQVNDLGHKHFVAFLEGQGFELITFGAIVVGKLLRDEDVSDLLPSLLDYYHEEYGIFFNGIGDTAGEYWYLMYVNALALEIIRRCYLDNAIWLDRVRIVMSTLMKLAHDVDYNFNDQGYDFAVAQPFTRLDAFRQPDTLGGYAYVMRMGFKILGDESYRQEALKALKLYQSYPINPWYEIPSGAMAVMAASTLKLENNSIDLERILAFSLDTEKGCLHHTAWGSKEIRGLMCGWRGHTREEAVNRAYSLESMVPIPFLLPLAKYHVEFASLLGRYLLHVIANLRWFFSEYLSTQEQSRPDLTAFIPYESIRHNEQGCALFGCGDFHGHKSIYGGALTLWLGEMISLTDDPTLLLVDLNKTDFLGDTSYPTFLCFNPYDDAREVTLSIPAGTWDVYDRYAHRSLGKQTNHFVTLSIPAETSMVIVLTPSDE